MLEKALSQKELSALLGMTTFEIYKKLCWQIEADYDMEHIWNKGGSCWRYEYINTVAAAELYVDYIYVKAV